MGIAILLTDANFSDANLGQVTFSNPVAVEGISLDDNISSFIGPSFKPVVDFTPVNTTERGVVWSIESGNSYATIDSVTGEVTVLSNANESVITIKAVSTSDNTLMATRNVTVTYNTQEVELITWIKTGGANYVLTDVTPDSSYSYETRFSPQGSFSNSAVVFGSRAGTSNNDCRISVNKTGATAYIFNSKTNNQALIAGLVTENIYEAKSIQTDPYYSMYDETAQESKVASSNNLNVSDFATSTQKIMLFNLNHSGAPLGSDYGFVKIYEFKVKQGNTVIADYVPALVDGTPVFFDKVSGNIFAITGNSEITHG